MTSHMTLRAGAILAITWLAFPSLATAETIVAPSAEWLVASSDVVVRGRITHVTIGLSKNREAWDKVTVEVAETLRGKHLGTIHFVVRQPSDEFGTEHLRSFIGKGEVLLFLVKSDAHKNAGPADFAEIELAPHEQTQPFDLSGKYPFALANLDFKVLGRPDDLLKFTRTTAKAMQGPPPVKRAVVHVPGGTEAFKKLWAGSGVLLTAPVNAAFEARANEWLGSKRLEYRTLGVRALGEFKSEENIKRMKALLASPDSQEVTSEGKRLRQYPLRHWAFEALEQWGIRVERPITEEPFESMK